MIKIDRFLIGFVFQLLAISVSANSSTNTHWKLEISIEKNTFLLREPIWLDVILTNVSKDTLRSWGLYPPCQGLGFDIEITDSVGNPIPYSGPEYDLALKAGFLLYPNEEFYDSFELLHLFGDYGDIFRFRMLPVGRYHLKTSYGDAVSNTIQLQIVGLSDEKKLALQKSMETSSIAIQKSIDIYSIARQESADSARSSLSTVIDALSNNPFAQNAALGILSWEEFLKRFPNSGHSKTSLEDITSRLNPQEKKEYLEDVMVKYKGTRAARHAEQALKLLGK